MLELKETDIYTIQFSKSGYLQYADFEVDKKTNRLITKNFVVCYQKQSEVPSLKNANTIEDALKIIKDYSFGNRAKIHRKNGNPIGKKKDINYLKLSNEFKEEIKKVYTNFWNKKIVPILNKENWKIENNYITINNKDPEKNYIYEQINFLCYKILYSAGKCKYNSFKSETGYETDYLGDFICNLNEEAIKNGKKKTK